MKRIILFVLMLGALNSMAQTTGYLRFDTVRIFKQGGTAELYLINSTKDSLGQLTNVGGGLTRFIKPRKLNDSTLIIGLDTISLAGNTQLFDLLDTRIAFGDANNQITDDADLTYSAATNRFNTGTGNFADSVLVEDLRNIALTDNPPIVVWDGVTKALAQISHNSYIKNQFAAKQSASAWYDSTKYHSGLIISSRGGGQASFYSPNLLWFMPQNNQSVFASIGTGVNDFPVLQLTTFNFNQANTRPGAIMAYNYNTAGASNKEFLITTSGFHASAAGDIRIAPGMQWTGSAFNGLRKTGDFHIILDPNASGEVQMTKITNFQYGWKMDDSVSTSTSLTITVAKAVWIFNGTSEATWTLPPIAGNTDVTFFIKNKSETVNLIISAETNGIFSTSPTTTFTIPPGQGYIFKNDASHYTILNN